MPSTGKVPVLVIFITFFLEKFITTLPKSHINVATTIFSKILEFYLSAELIIVLLGSYLG